jgi:hypothetical protein
VGLNSALRDGPEESPHHGQVLDDQIREIDNWLRDNAPIDCKYKLFVTHHHPIQYSDPVSAEPDFSIMVNAENLLRRLSDHNFDFVVHGHKHVPRFQIHSTDMSIPLVLLGAGSFCVRLEPNLSGVVANQFHLLEIEGRDSTTGHAYGLLKSWTYLTGHHWVESSRHQGIRHISPFGRYANVAELIREVRPLIPPDLQMRGWTTWLDVVAKSPTLKYVQYTVVRRVLETLAEEISFRIRGDSLDELVLLREVSHGSS